MIDPAAFSAKLAQVKTAMEREEWARAIKLFESLGPVPERLQGVASSVGFYLYVSRNEYAKLARHCGNFQLQLPKDTVSAMLLLRDKALEYPLKLPRDWSLAAWEKAVGTHLASGALEPKEIRLCLFFLSQLDRPALLEELHRAAVTLGEEVDEELSTVVVRCLVRHKKFAEARRFIWINQPRGTSFARFSFLIDRAEKGETAVPESDDKFLRFLKYRFGANLPINISSVLKS
jgi:hypothetical protein